MNRKTIAIMTIAMLALASLLAGCYGGPSQAGYQGAAVGGGVGATAGALLDDNNRWRGGVIGGALGAVLGGAITEISSQAARQAAQQQQPVMYRNQSGTQSVVAQPISRRGNCYIVREKHYQNGQLVRVTEREVCD